MEKSNASAGQDPFKSLLSDMIQEKLGSSGRTRTILITLQGIMAFVQTVVERLEESNVSPKVSCASGCSYCCHSKINIIPVEALLIHSFIEMDFNAKEIFDLKSRIQKNRSLTQGKSFQEKVAIRDKTPCIFLENNACSVYTARPFICRSWHSFDRSECAKAFVSGNHDAEIKTFAGRNYMFGIARDLFRDISDQLNIEDGVFEMPEAVLNCFESSDPLGNWLDGITVFDPGQKKTKGT